MSHLGMNVRSQKGVALIEIALALALVTLLFASFGPLFLKNQTASNAKLVALEHTAFKNAASAHFQSNRSAYISAMQDGTGADKLCKVGVLPDGTGGAVVVSDTLHRCAVDASMLKYLGAIPSSTPDKNRYGETWVAIFKAAYNNEVPPVATGGVEMWVVSAKVDGTSGSVAANAELYDEAKTAASFTGGQGGVIPDADRSTCVASRAMGKFEACGAGWRSNLSDFLEASEVAAFAARLSK